MATDSATYTPALTTDGPNAALDRTAGRRILRQFAVFIACGYLAYLVLTLPAITASLQVMHLGWTIPALLCVFGPGLALGPLAWRAPTRRLRIAAAITALGYIVAVATWWFGWTGEHLTGNTDIWFSLFCGLAAIAAALALPPRYSSIVLVVVVVAATMINHVVRAPEANGPLVPGLAWAFAFSLVYFAAAVMGMHTAAVLDDTRGAKRIRSPPRPPQPKPAPQNASGSTSSPTTASCPHCSPPPAKATLTSWRSKRTPPSLTSMPCAMAPTPPKH